MNTIPEVIEQIKQIIANEIESEKHLNRKEFPKRLDHIQNQIFFKIGRKFPTDTPQGEK
jgi:hypothetical protein